VKTDELITRLAETPVPAHAPIRMLAFGLAAGVAVSFAIMFVSLGLRQDFGAALATPMFWMKLGYAVALAALALPLLVSLSRPTGALTRGAYFLLLPIGAFALMAAYRLMEAAPDARMHLVMGDTWRACSRNIFTLSLPVLVGVFLSLRQLAPTRLVAAGAVAGVLAGAAGTFVYAFHCFESAAPFILIWYTLGMAAVGALGGLLGRWALRW
jgi:hypothetical protein